MLISPKAAPRAGLTIPSVLASPAAPDAAPVTDDKSPSPSDILFKPEPRFNAPPRAPKAPPAPEPVVSNALVAASVAGGNEPAPLMTLSIEGVAGRGISGEILALYIALFDCAFTPPRNPGFL